MAENAEMSETEVSNENFLTEDKSAEIGENINEILKEVTENVSENPTDDGNQKNELVNIVEAVDFVSEEKAAKPDDIQQEEETNTDIQNKDIVKDASEIGMTEQNVSQTMNEDETSQKDDFNQMDIDENVGRKELSVESIEKEKPEDKTDRKVSESLDFIAPFESSANLETNVGYEIDPQPQETPKEESKIDAEMRDKTTENQQEQSSSVSEADKILEKRNDDFIPLSSDNDNDFILDFESSENFEANTEHKIDLQPQETSKEESKMDDDVQGQESTENQSDQACSTSEADTSLGKRKLSDNPEDIINLLKSLSPEKLLEIKSKVLEIADQKDTSSTSSDFKKLKTDETKTEEEKAAPEEKDAVSNNDVICLDDSDEEGGSKGESKEESNKEKEAQNQEKENENESENVTESLAAEKTEMEVETPAEENKENDDHKHLNGDSSRLNLKECINPECPRNKDDEYLESPLFVLNMYYIARKPNKIQLVCSTCYEEALATYDVLCSKFLSNDSWTKVKIPKKQDLVEIIDSDEEDDPSEKPDKMELDELDLIIFDEEVEKEVEEIVLEFTSKIDIQLQIDAEYKIIASRINNHDKTLAEINDEITQLERKSYKMYEELYSYNRPKIQRRQSLNIDDSLSDVINNQNAASEISITPVTRQNSTSSLTTQKSQEQAEQICYAIRKKGDPMPPWLPCRILEDLSTQDEKKFKIQFCDNMPNNLTIVSGKEISHPIYSEKLEIGARVIALFPRSTVRNKPQSRFLPGVIGEKLTQYNKKRYLVFCDYGQVRYCNAHEVRPIQETSENVWDDVHPNLRQFIRDYLESKTNRSRPLLNVRVNTQIMTERAGSWRKTVVQEVDCSLVKVYFVQEHLCEWLYRGSKRLYGMFQQTQRTQHNSFQRRNDPGQFSYITIDDDESNSSESAASNETKRNIAKKSTAKTPQPVQQQQQQVVPSTSSAQAPIILNDRNIYLEEPAEVGKVRHFTPIAKIRAKKYAKHECSTACLPGSQHNLSSFSPLSKPLLSCWERQIVKQRNNKFVIYKAPCGRRLRNMHEVFVYLNKTKCNLNVDNFTFDFAIQVLAGYYVDKSLCPLYIDDITEGKEGMKVTCINAFDQQKPPPLVYSPNRIPMTGVNINTDPEFMSCCDCTDECFDKSKCACFQMTIRGAKYKNIMEEDEEHISYFWKRLTAVVPTGIYECNSRCKCSKRCLNKVVQQPICVKMLLHRTKARGWGLQTLHDIEKGTFICIYAGNLYTEKDANALCQGLDHGDEYFAELDLIENAENRKEGYESGVVYPESEEEKDSDSDYDDRKDSQDYDDGDFVPKTKGATGQREIVTRSSKTSLTEKRHSSTSSIPRQNSEDSSDDEMVSMMPSANNNGNLGYPENMRIPFRKLYGPKEKVYIMDAKRCGNIGRYFNHSCDPNLFVQSVFVDTHDLRFPWIAFFAQRNIKAGEELTWNYNYEVGSVPSKVLYCKCGSKNCRGRIL